MGCSCLRCTNNVNRAIPRWCTCLKCTNKANRAISRGCTCLKCTNKANRANYRRVWHPAIPTQTPNYLPTETTEPTEVYDARYSPTDGTDGHRLGGYDIPAIPTQPPNYLPTEAYAA